jgi:hypothetical protein
MRQEHKAWLIAGELVLRQLHSRATHATIAHISEIHVPSPIPDSQTQCHNNREKRSVGLGA